MAFEEKGSGGEIKNFNSAKQITEFMDLRLVKELLDSFYVARRGVKPEQNIEEINLKTNVENKVQGLKSITYALKDLIMRGRGEIESEELTKWMNKNKGKEDKDKTNFEDEENDYNRLEYQRRKVNACFMDLIEAQKTRSLKDDFMVRRDTADGEIYEVTDKYYEMLEELEDSWKEIEKILKQHKILSQGMIVDEELNYKEQERLFMERFKEA